MNEESGDDSPPRPKRRIKVMITSSASDSDSDDISASRPRKKKLRILSEDETSDSSASPVCAATRRRRILPKLSDSDVESDASASGNERLNVPKPASTTSKPTSGFASDSSEGNSDKCSICLLRFTNQEIGTPVNCDHIFCLDCITEWSRNVNTCPVDRIKFESIVVRACVGGRVLRTDTVKLTERRSSLELFVIENLACEICGRADEEESMLVCDNCDLGFHMLCLTPPLSEVPAEYWFCNHCTGLHEQINLSEEEDLYSDISNIEMPLGPRITPLRILRRLRRSIRLQQDQPSTSGRTGRNMTTNREVPSTSRNSVLSQRNSSRSTLRHSTSARSNRKRKTSRRVVIEYEVEENGDRSVRRRVKPSVKRKRKSRKRQPRTAARRSHVRACVRARLGGQAGVGAADLAASRERAGIGRLSLFGNNTQLEFFSDEDEAQVPSQPAPCGPGSVCGTAVAPRQPHIVDVYRRMRRKTINILSPPPASTPPDLLSGIIESQALLHARNTVLTVTPSGNLNIQKRSAFSNKKTHETKKDDRLDLSKAEDEARKVPSYPGQSRGGGWGGGYRGTYNRDQNTSNFNRGGNYDNSYGGGYQSRQGPGRGDGMLNYQNSSNNRRDEPDFYDNFTRRPHQYTPADDPYFERTRRPAPNDMNRTQNFPNTLRLNEQNHNRYSLGSSWQPYGNAPPVSRQEMPPATARHSFGGFENPLDMRMGQLPPTSSNTDLYSRDPPQHDKPRAAYSQPANTQTFQPLPEPPTFGYQKSVEIEKSEDEKSDTGLVIDTEKYDPTEPTVDDDDSGEEQRSRGTPAEKDTESPGSPPRRLDPVHSILAGIDTSNMNVPSNVLDNAVRQVLKEHRNLYVASSDFKIVKSDDDSEGDCPNFSIYSATSVHIANNSNSLTEDIEDRREPEQSGLEDLVQEDDDIPTPGTASPVRSEHEMTDATERIEDPPVIETGNINRDFIVKNRINEEYKEKVSKRCPITTSTRNPIKIKLFPPSLIKRQVSLYDDEDTSQDVDVPRAAASVGDKSENSTKANFDTADENSVKDTNDYANEAVSELKNKPSIENEEHSKHEENKALNNVVGEDVAAEPDVGSCKDDRPDDVATEVVEQSHVDDTCDGSCQDDNGMSDSEMCLNVPSPKELDPKDMIEENIEKMTESISETEDERSYTPCLDENKPREDAFDTDKEKGIEGLDTEMISEDEGNELFSESERPPSVVSRAVSPPPKPGAVEEDVGVPEKKKSDKKKEGRDEGKKKKKKESKKEGKDKNKSKKKADVAFKKLSKSGKERNYREREKDDKKSKKDRRSSSEPEGKSKRRKEKRKDLERYDVRNVVSEKRRKVKDPFGRDVSPRGRSPSISPERRSPSAPLDRKSPRRRRSTPRARPSPPRIRSSLSRPRRSISRGRHSINRARRSLSRARRSISRARRSMSRVRRSPASRRVSPAARRPRRSATPRSTPPRPSPRPSPARKRRRRSPSRARARRSASPSPRRAAKKKKRARAEPSPARRRVQRADRSPRRRSRSLSAARVAPSPSVDSRLLSPRTPPPAPLDEAPPPGEARRRRRDPTRRRPRDAPGPSKEVFTSGDNILVSVSFNEQQDEAERRRKRGGKRRRRRRAAPPDLDTHKPVAIIDLERSPFRELTPSPKNVIVLSDSEPGEKEPAAGGGAAPPSPCAARELPVPAEPAFPAGPKTPPSPSHEPAPAEPPRVSPAAAAHPAAPHPAPATLAAAPPSPAAYDPFEPTRSPSATRSPSPVSPAPPDTPSARSVTSHYGKISSSGGAGGPGGGATPPRTLMTLEAAQRTNMSADEVLDRRPLEPAEKVLALLQSTRDAPPEPPPPATHAAPALPHAAPRIVLPSPTRTQPKLFPGKPSPIKSNPVKPMQAVQAPSDSGASPYSPGSSDFGDLFEPPGARRDLFDLMRGRRGKNPKVPVKLAKKQGKTQVGVKIDEDNLKILDDLPSSAVEMQVKSKGEKRARDTSTFLKKLNRQERVVEEVKLVLKPHYNKKHVSKDEYKDILRRAVPKICHNKTGEINPAKIQSLVEAYVKKIRKKHKLGIL